MTYFEAFRPKAINASQMPEYHAAPIFDTPHAAKVRAQLDAMRQEANQ